MKIAFSSAGSSPDSAMDSRFGRSKYFLVYDDGEDSWKPMDNSQNVNSMQGAGIQAAGIIADEGCNVLVSGHCGPKAFRMLSAAGIDVYLGGEGTVFESLEAFRSGKLEKIDGADVEGHW